MLRQKLCGEGGDLCCELRDFFVRSATNVLLAFVVVAIFASTIVWSCFISVNNASLTCADFTLAAYPLVFKVLEDLRFSLNALAS